MDDEVEDLVFIQFYHATMRVISKFSLSNPFSGSNTNYAGYAWRMTRIYLTKPEVLVASIVLFILLLYFQLAERSFYLKFPKPTGLSKNLISSALAEKECIDLRKSNSAMYSIQGRRPKQEDRFVVEENVNNDTGIAFYAIFDGHGGEFAAEFAKDILVQNLYNKMKEVTNILKGKTVPTNRPQQSQEEEVQCMTVKEEKPVELSAAQRRKSFKKSLSQADDHAADELKSNQSSNVDLFLKLNALSKPFTKEDFLQPVKGAKTPVKPKVFDAQCYIENRQINFGKMLTDEVLAADWKLVETAKKSTNISGSTALMMVVHQQKLIVANVGDSRGIMCDFKGNAIPLSFDHKPQQVREHKRIHDAGGFIQFRGVWRVAGILATSRALGDYPLKDRNLVIADPDILTFDLIDHKPNFVILASDGLWDTFSNEEAVAFIKDRLTEPHFGAKSIVLESYNRGSVDNITVIVIIFKDGKYEFGSSSQ